MVHCIKAFLNAPNEASGFNLICFPED